jgi:xanthine dehydrogenase YagR molybdenum-binding subunit
VSEYVGGGFGGKVVGPESVLAAIGAQRTGRPVKVALTRQQIFHATYHRTETHQRVRLACDADGRLTGIGQESVVTQNGFNSFEPVALGAVSLYRAAARTFTTRIVDLNVAVHSAVRAPGEAVGQLAIETAMDEMAERLGLDPIEFRRLNEPEVDPTSGEPFSTRRLMDCFDEGARRFGWERRQAKPGQVREGEWLIGYGTASAIRVNFLQEAEARVRLTPDGRAVVETDMTDIGTGSYTILAQIAGEALGLPIACIDVKLGDTGLPGERGSGGSFGAASTGRRWRSPARTSWRSWRGAWTRPLPR